MHLLQLPRQLPLLLFGQLHIRDFTLDNRLRLGLIEDECVRPPALFLFGENFLIFFVNGFDLGLMGDTFWTFLGF